MLYNGISLLRPCTAEFRQGRRAKVGHPPRTTGVAHPCASTVLRVLLVSALRPFGVWTTLLHVFEMNVTQVRASEHESCQLRILCIRVPSHHTTSVRALPFVLIRRDCLVYTHDPQLDSQPQYVRAISLLWLNIDNLIVDATSVFIKDF